jgi:hypothetical protein
MGVACEQDIYTPRKYITFEKGKYITFEKGKSPRKIHMRVHACVQSNASHCWVGVVGNMCPATLFKLLGIIDI